MTEDNEVKLIRAGRAKFIAMAATYCLGVFNDNYFKQAVLLLAVSAGLSKLQGPATVLFALPFLLFSACAGWLADRFPKKKVVIGAKGLELVAMLIGAIGIISGNWACILAMLFLMGMQSALFSPALNGSIPELYPGSYVPKANAILKLMTTLAILAGIATAGISLDQNWMPLEIPFGTVLVAGVVVVVAVLGFFAAFGVYSRPAANPEKPFPWLGPIRSVENFLHTRSDRQLFWAIIADSYFYFIASIAVLVINTLGIEQLGFSKTVTSLLPVSLMIGICVGSVIAARITVMDRWFRPMLPAMAGMAAGLILAGATPLLPLSWRFPWLSANLVFTGIAGGVFLIPVTSFLQVRPADKDKGRVLATANFCTFVGILLAGPIFSSLISLMSPASAMAGLGGFALVCAGLVYARVGMPILHRLLRLALRLRYHIVVRGMEKIPATHAGGIIFLPNHPALIDPVICLTELYGKFRPRPLVDLDQGKNPVARLALKRINPIMIPDLHRNGRDSRSGIKQAMTEVVTALKQGDNIVLYPAGRIYRSAREDLGGNSGVEYILNNATGVKVVMVRTSGLWGSSFSFATGTEPTLFKNISKYLGTILVNGIFFTPRRQVTLDLLEDDLSTLPDRRAINRHLEEFYNSPLEKPSRIFQTDKSGRAYTRRDHPVFQQDGNAIPQPNTWVPYYWWQGNTPRILPEPEKKTYLGSVENIPESIREMVTAKVAELAGRDTVKGSDRLANDLGIDSLALMDLAVWLENEFGVTLDDMSALAGVDDCILAAGGQVFEKNQRILTPVNNKWFSGSPARSLVFPVEKTISAAFLHQARRYPGEIIIADQISGAKSYRQLLTAIMVLRPYIEKIEAERIGIMLPASVSAVIVYLAVLFAGKTPVMMNWTVGIGNMKHCLAVAGVSHIISATALKKKLSAQGTDLSALPDKWLFIDEIAAGIPLWRKVMALARARFRPGSTTANRVAETAAILFTSGSESRPKAVPLSHANIIANMRDFTDIMAVNAADRLLGMLPPFHSLGLVGTVVMPVCLGLKTVYHPNPTESVTLARLIEHYKVSMLIGTPTFLGGIANAAEREQLLSIRLLFSGAEKCPEHVYQAFADICPRAVLCEGYGITECSPLVSINRVDNPRPGTIGRLMPSIKGAIVHPEERRRVNKGERGILLVRGPNIFSGYYNGDQDKGFSDFEGERWYDTGDFVREDEDGNLVFCGRKKRFIKLGGEMISLPAIEAALHQYLPAADDNGPTMAVEATPTEENPEIVLFSTITLERENVNQYIREAGLSALHNVRRLISIDTIPVLGTCKTDYKQLKEMLAGL